MFGSHRKAVVVLAAGALALGAQANAQISDWVYDTTNGATSVYTGDLTAGSLSLEDIDGSSFRVQRVAPGFNVFDFGVFGAGVGAGASLSADMSLVDWIPATPGPDGDKAIFAGAGLGSDFVLVDEFGETLSGSIDVFELTDNTGSIILPGIVGQGSITDLVFSGSTFQNISTDDLFDFGNVLTFSFVIGGVTLEDYLASSGLGGLPVVIETVEARVRGIPLPATTGLAFAGLIPFGALSARRRR